MRGKSLEYENWLYRLDHLIGHIKVAADCKVCEWHAGLLPSTIKLVAITEGKLGTRLGTKLGAKLRKGLTVPELMP